MTTTAVTGATVIGILGGGGFAAAAALAGALGLGLAALALKGSRNRGGGTNVYHVHQQGGGYGSGGGYGGGSSGGGGGGYYRKKRAVTGAYANENDFETQNDWKEAKAKEEALLEVVRAEDASGCGMKMVCQLASMNQEHLTEDLKAILELVGSPLHPSEVLWSPDRASPLSVPSKLEYRVARGLGQRGVDCGAMYPACPVQDVPGLMHAILP